MSIYTHIYHCPFCSFPQKVDLTDLLSGFHLGTTNARNWEETESWRHIKILFLWFLDHNPSDANLATELFGGDWVERGTATMSSFCLSGIGQMAFYCCQSQGAALSFVGFLLSTHSFVNCSIIKHL